MNFCEVKTVNCNNFLFLMQVEDLLSKFQAEATVNKRVFARKLELK